MRHEDGRILLGCVEMADQIACAAASLVDVWSCYTTENLTEVQQVPNNTAIQECMD